MKQSKINMFVRISIVMLFFSYTFMFTGCSDDDPVTSSSNENIDFNYIGSSDTTDQIGALIIESVKVLLRDIKFNVSNNNDDSVNFQTGPYVLYVNNFTGISFLGGGVIPEGTYDQVKFMVHKLNNNETPPDPEFADANGRYSVIVKGFYLGTPFIYKSTKSAHQKLTFPNSLVATVNGKTNITLRMKPYIWFIKNNLYLDPNDDANRNDIDNNIKDNINNNFKIFIDNDKNGIED